MAPFAVTAVGADHPGIVHGVTRHLADAVAAGLGVTCTLHPSGADIL